MIGEVETSTAHFRKLTDILGVQDMKTNLESPFDFIQIAKDGVNASVIKNFGGYFNLSRELLASMLNVSTPTIYRWTKENRNLDINFTIKLFEIADLFLSGSEVLGNESNFFKWLNLPNTALGGMEPIELIGIPGGVSKVRDVIGRIAYGVYS